MKNDFPLQDIHSNVTLGILGDVHESEPPLLSTTVNKLFPHVSSESRLTLFFLRIHVFDIATTAAIYYET